MDPRIYRPKPMRLLAALLDLQLADRLSYDAERNTLFVNFEGLAIRSSEDIDSVRRVFEALCSGIGHKVALVVNYDGFRIDETLSDAYFEMVGELQRRHYSTATRYTTSAFMRMKLGAALSTRQSAAHVFETHAEAVAFASQQRIGGTMPWNLKLPRSARVRRQSDSASTAAATSTGTRSNATTAADRFSLRELAERHRCSHSAIANFAGRHGWTRHPSPAVEGQVPPTGQPTCCAGQDPD